MSYEYKFGLEEEEYCTKEASRKFRTVEKFITAYIQVNKICFMKI